MRSRTFESSPDGRDIWIEADDAPPRTGSVTPGDPAPETVVQAPDAGAVDAPTIDATPPGAGPEPMPPPTTDCGGGSLANAAPDDDGQAAAAPAELAVRTTVDGIPLSQILHDRPDVFRLFFTEYYGPNNDRHSDAWIDRVGGATPEDYAKYWYEHGGMFEYAPADGAAARSPVDPSVYAGGRTTSDGVYLEQILHDRPDVYGLFFTEYYGPNNDHRSGAWMDRVGGATPQDYAKYWYEHGGMFEYAPEPLKVDPPEPEAAPPPEPDDAADRPADDPAPAEDAADASAVDPAILLVGQTLGTLDPLGV